jgi:hypothetical protein
MTVMDSIKAELDEYKHVVRQQIAEIDKLRIENQALVDWIQGDSDALTCLQTIYNSSTASEGNKVRAAAAAIGYERPKMMATNLVVLDFRERVRQARLKAPLVEPKVIEHIPLADAELTSAS